MNYESSKSIDKCLDDIRTQYERAIDTLNEIKQENAVLKDEYYKDITLKEMKDQLERMKCELNRGFPITEEEAQRIDKWRKDHISRMHPGSSINKSRSYISFFYEFHPTELGTSGKIVCNKCRDKVRNELGVPKNFNSLVDYWVKKDDLVKKYDSEFYFKEIK